MTCRMWQSCIGAVGWLVMDALWLIIVQALRQPYAFGQVTFFQRPKVLVIIHMHDGVPFNFAWGQENVKATLTLTDI